MQSKTAMRRVEGFRRMIAQLAYRMWCVLPHQHQIWIGVDDLIEDGMFRAFQITRSAWRDESRSSLCTTIYHAVHNHLYNEYVVRYGNEMRFASLESAGIIEKKRKGNTPADIVSIDALQSEEQVIELPQLSTSEATIYDNVLTDCFVVPVLGKIYQEASSRLQNEMIVWFLQNREKIHLKSPKFRRAAKEFRMLSKEFNLTYWDCEHLMHSPFCMNRLSHELLSVPYDINHPAPAMDKEL